MQLMNDAQKKSIEFIRTALEVTGDSPTTLARKAGLSPSTLTRLFKGDTKFVPSSLTLAKIANYAGIPSPLDMAKHHGHSSPALKSVPLFGYVGAGAKVYPFEDCDPVDYVELPYRSTDEIGALIVHGESMFPAYWEGDIVFFQKEDYDDPKRHLFEECIVFTENEELYIKQVHPGSTSGTYTLVSYNAPPIVDTALKWVAPVFLVDRRNRSAKKGRF